jgi:hypothetical protein
MGKNIKKLFILAFLIFVKFSFAQGQDLFNLENSKKFADYLYGSGEYNLAAEEYERIVFLDSSDSESKLNLIRSYRNNGEFNKAIKKNLLFFEEEKSMSTKFAKEYSCNLYYASQISHLKSFISINDSLLPSEKDLIALACYLKPAQ